MSSRRSRQMVAGLAVAAIAVAGLEGLAIAGGQAGPSAAEKRQATEAGDPSVRLPDAERDQKYQAGLKESAARRAQWIRSFQASGGSADTLPRVPLMLSPKEAQPTLKAAVARARWIVSGRVVSNKYTPDGTESTIEVDDSLKGGAARKLTVKQLGGPEPLAGFGQDAVVGYNDADPVLLGQQSVLLFLEDADPSDPTQSLRVQPFTGQYVVQSDQVQALPGNPFRGQFQGKTLADAKRNVRAEMQGS